MATNILIALIFTNCISSSLALIIGFFFGAIGIGIYHHNTLRKQGYMMTKDGRLYPLSMFTRTGRGANSGHYPKQQEMNDE